MNPIRWLTSRIRRRVVQRLAPEPENGHRETTSRIQRRQDRQAEELARLRRLRQQRDIMRRNPNP